MNTKEENRKWFLMKAQDARDNFPCRSDYYTDINFVLARINYDTFFTDGALLLSENERNILWELVYMQGQNYDAAIIRILTDAYLNPELPKNKEITNE